MIASKTCLASSALILRNSGLIVFIVFNNPIKINAVQDDFKTWYKDGKISSL